MPGRLAHGLLAQLAIERIGIAPNTPIKKLLRFREKYADELARFRTKIQQLASGAQEDLPVEALRQRVADLHANEISPAVHDLKKALHGQRIQRLSEGLLKIAFMSAGPAMLLAGLDVPTALLAGAGLSLVVSGAVYRAGKAESLRNNPYAYLLSMERSLL